MKNLFRNSKLVLLALFCVSGNACLPIEHTNNLEIVKGIEELKIKGHVTKDGAPFARRSMTLTSTAYYSKLGINQTLNAGIQTDEFGNFEVDATLMLCAARPDFVEFTRRLIEVDHSVSDWMAGAILLPGLVVGGSGSDSHTVVREFSTKRIPRSICDNFDPTKNDFAFTLNAPSESYKDYMGDKGDRAADEAIHKQRDTILDQDDTPQMSAGIRSEITPIEFGVISLDQNFVTNGIIASSEYEVTRRVFNGSVYFVTLPDPKTGQSVPTYNWSSGKLYRLVVQASFDLSKPTEEAPGQLAR